MSSKATTPAPPSDKQVAEYTVDVQDKIRNRAFELYEQRGRENGHDLEDWLRAESELVQPKTKKASA
jgi:Protein of unknown function (DUF2934)